MKRRNRDIMRLMTSNFECSMGDDNSGKEFLVKFHGPSGSPYEGGTWKVLVKLPADYPYKSPSIGFCNRIFHPNIDEPSGSVCLDVINQTWSPMFDLVNIFSSFLPQLLLYPNPSDPLNGQAAALMMKHKDMYDVKVREYVKLYASQPIKVKMDESEDDEDEPLSEPDDD